PCTCRLVAAARSVRYRRRTVLGEDGWLTAAASSRRGHCRCAARHRLAAAPATCSRTFPRARPVRHNTGVELVTWTRVELGREPRGGVHGQGIAICAALSAGVSGGGYSTGPEQWKIASADC